MGDRYLPKLRRLTSKGHTPEVFIFKDNERQRKEVNIAIKPGVRNILILTVLVVMPLSVATGQTTRKAKSKAAAKDEAAIKTVTADLVRAWNRHDAKAFAVLFAADAAFIDVVGQTAEGRAAIEQLHAPLFATVFKESHVEPTGLHVRFVKSDVAAVDSTWGVTGYADPDDSKHSLRKAVMIVSFIMLKHQGRWSVAVMHKLV